MKMLQSRVESTNPESYMRIDRFVLDNNIWISYLATKRIQVLLDIIDENGLTIYSCDELIEEFKTVLNYPRLKKFKINIAEAVKVLRRATVHYSITYPIKRYVPNDENDEYLIALALQTSAGFITSGMTIFFL